MLFHFFFSDELVDLVCRETNRFAQQTGPGDRNWRPVTASEIRVFFFFFCFKYA